MFGCFPREATVFPTKSTSTSSIYIDLISRGKKEERRSGEGGGSVIFGEEFAARYIERAMRKKPGGQKVLWVLIRRTSGRVPWRGFICANEITVISSTPCLILRQPVRSAMDTARPAHNSTTDISAIRVLPSPYLLPFDLFPFDGGKLIRNFHSEFSELEEFLVSNGNNKIRCRINLTIFLFLTNRFAVTGNSISIVHRIISNRKSANCKRSILCQISSKYWSKFEFTEDPPEALFPNWTIAVIWKIPLEIIHLGGLDNPCPSNFYVGRVCSLHESSRNSRFVQVRELALDRSVFRRSNPSEPFCRLRTTLSLVRGLFSRLLHPYRALRFNYSYWPEITSVHAIFRTKKS